jgi:hypothetical protein
VTIAETIAVHQELASRAATWVRTRGDYLRQLTSPAYTGAEKYAAMRRHEDAGAALAEVVERVEDRALPAAGGTTAAAREVLRLEGEIVLAAISWYRANEQLADSDGIWTALGHSQRVDDRELALREVTGRLLEQLAQLTAVSA